MPTALPSSVCLRRSSPRCAEWLASGFREELLDGGPRLAAQPRPFELQPRRIAIRTGSDVEVECGRRHDRRGGDLVRIDGLLTREQPRIDVTDLVLRAPRVVARVIMELEEK